MVKLYGNDRSTGKEAETAAEMRKRGCPTTNKDFFEFDDLDNRICKNEVSLEDFDTYDDGDGYSDNFSTQDIHSQDHSLTTNYGSRTKKSKVDDNKDKDTELNEFKEVMHEVAEALKEGNVILREHYNYKMFPMLGDKVWNLIKNSGCDENSRPKIYCALMEDANKLRTVLQCPIEARKEVIMQLVFD